MSMRFRVLFSSPQMVVGITCRKSKFYTLAEWFPVSETAVLGVGMPLELPSYRLGMCE